MELSVRTEGPAHIVLLKECRLDATVALGFKEKIRELMENEPSVVILDMSGVSFIDSSGLGAIVATMKHLSPDCRLVLAGMTTPVDRVFKLTKMDSAFSVYATVSVALDAQVVA